MRIEDILVSVIVPAFNVEKYIAKCIQSISEQTYKNIEIIIINDGSSDKTMDFVGEARDKDNRISVICQTNHGVSYSRNVGLLASRGEYVMFVDGDDFLAKDCVEYLLGVCLTTRTNFSLSLNCYSSKSDFQVRNDKIRRISEDEAVLLLLSPRVVVGSWNKIFYKKFLTNNSLLFNEGLFYGEGLHFIVRSALLSGGVGVGERRVYFYRKNNDFSATTKFNYRKFVNGEESLDLISALIKNRSQFILPIFYLHRALFALGAEINCIDYKINHTDKKEYLHWHDEVPVFFRKIVFKKGISPYYQVLVFSGLLFPRLIAILDRRRRKRIYRKSVD